ncbi:hypothetical protein [Nocardia ignorata]|uniref:Uncharacterized protein n=2 Tax=Nocardia ignorata TaxID=145285 RepID=A0A4V6PUJ2_NOCIG|nr:hypothetical protein [Nocardia ignorata]TDP31512.1 hypothetical protein DFR75_108117 [Nocardia ignorata]
MDLTSTGIMLATCVFFLFGLTALTGSFFLAIAASLGLAAAMIASTKMVGLDRL